MTFDTRGDTSDGVVMASEGHEGGVVGDHVVDLRPELEERVGSVCGRRRRPWTATASISGLQ